MCKKVTTFFENLKLLETLNNIFVGKRVVADRAFKFGTKYTSLILMSLTLFSVNTQLKCDGSAAKPNTNEHCEHVGTFLVANALKPEMEKKVISPGIGAYNREVDDVIWQYYHTHSIGIYGCLIGIALVPYFLWQVIKLFCDSIIVFSVNVHFEHR